MRAGSPKNSGAFEAVPASAVARSNSSSNVIRSDLLGTSCTCDCAVYSSACGALKALL